MLPESNSHSRKLSNTKSCAILLSTPSYPKSEAQNHQFNPILFLNAFLAIFAGTGGDPSSCNICRTCGIVNAFNSGIFAGKLGIGWPVFLLTRGSSLALVWERAMIEIVVHFKEQIVCLCKIIKSHFTNSRVVAVIDLNEKALSPTSLVCWVLPDALDASVASAILILDLFVVLVLYDNWTWTNACTVREVVFTKVDPSRGNT
ncbi:uncharacterized protein LY89DRAFT_300633 [Mollisia scopiformis]|uniref:Uncharacterized protein n=1 Tax=Mollisia scopiformis TaxID=149040 RepID=A0A194XQP3_MOLSC|nr:uncharacterized protein LY89DRAFT_300633 [Mollisia scopiformis]KUJ22486.1 hypothetical protein LY89DRAFT_300633 [Mollisia scopiformis]